MIILINNYFKCKWVECPNQKTKTGWMDTKTRPLYMLSTRDPTSKQGTHTDWKWRAGKKIFHAIRDQKKAGVPILISDKIDFKTKAVKRDKEGHYLMIKGSIQEEDTTIINTTIVEDFNTWLTPMDR